MARIEYAAPLARGSGTKTRILKMKVTAFQFCRAFGAGDLILAPASHPFAKYERMTGARSGGGSDSPPGCHSLPPLFQVPFLISRIEKGHFFECPFSMRETGLEPVRCEPHAPQTCASASSATLALPPVSRRQSVLYYNPALLSTTNSNFFGASGAPQKRPEKACLTPPSRLTWLPL